MLDDKITKLHTFDSSLPNSLQALAARDKEKPI